MSAIPGPALAPIGAARRGDWIQTFTGQRFWPLDPHPAEIAIEDIAHALAMKCRYGGHCLAFYSVAEHSVLLSQAVEARHARWALLHDAAEAYLADVPRPVKPELTGWKAIEAAVMRAVCLRFGLDTQEPAEVKAADTAILADEKWQVMAEGPAWGAIPARGLGVAVRCLPPPEAKALFLARFAELFGEARHG